jgi:hypothetical protein
MTEEQKQYFDIPYMSVAREDVASVCLDEQLDTVEEEEQTIVAFCKTITDEQMENIAREMSDYMMDCYWDSLNIVCSKILKETT